MALYELRTYTLYVGKMAEAVKLYQEIGFPALQKGGQDADSVSPGDVAIRSDMGKIRGGGCGQRSIATRTFPLPVARNHGGASSQDCFGH